MHEHDHHTNNIKLALALNIGFTIIEIIGGLYTNSLTILADAIHDLGDTIALFTAWISEKASHKQADPKRTFGYRRVSLFSAFFSAIILITGSLFILTQALPRLFNPEPVHTQGMFILASIGILFNGLAALRLKRGHGMNEKVLSWHLLEDVFGWIIVLIGSVLIHFTDSPVIDPLMTIGFTAFILWGVVKSLTEIANIFLQGVPSHISLDHINQGLSKLDGIVGVHDMHVWSLEGETDVLTAHFVVSPELLKNPAHTKAVIRAELDQHHIEHSTIELESDEECRGDNCHLK